MDKIKAHPGLEFSLLATLALLWGSSYLLIKVALDTIPPVTLIAVRVSFAALFLLAVSWWRSAPLPRDAQTWRLLFVQAVLNSIGAWTVLAWGQQYVDSGLATVLNSTSPIFVFFITLLFTRHEPVSSVKFAGACLGLFGVTIIIGVDALNGLGKQVIAQIAILSGAALYAGAAIFGKRFAHLPPSVTAAGTMIWASIVLLPASLILDRPWTLEPSAISVLATITLGLLNTGIALLIYFRLIETLGSMGVASQAYLRVGVGVLLGVAILGETITPVIGLGLAAAVLGVIAINTTHSGR